MARGRINHERWIQHYLDRWIYLMALGSWRISYEVEAIVRDSKGNEVEAHSWVWYPIQKQHIAFNSRLLRTKKQIEEAVIHEVALHLFDRGARTRDIHILGNRLIPVLRVVRIRASRVYI